MENTVILEHQGFIKYETVGELILKFKVQIRKTDVPVGIYKRIQLVMIESLENIMKHSPAAETYTKHQLHGEPVLLIRKVGHDYEIFTSNLISFEKIKSLQEKIDHLNSLDSQGLKELYKATITNGEFNETGGAGLGLIEIARVSGKRIHYDFEPVFPGHSRFTQSVTISAEK
ncbi:MAG: SiaB family protein kinase [Bacteroidales bacterium]|nr:SiaB family protein kinase [Bacteroidales bacterium]